METEHSSIGESTSTSTNTGNSSGTSEGEEEVFETVKILGQTLELPQELCEDYSIFREFFSMKTWESLESTHKEHLRKLLPNFPENDEEEKTKTLEMLFNYEPFHFTSPLDNFYGNLKQGNYRPDIAKMRNFLRKARAKQQKHKIKSYYAKLLPEVLISRERLLAAAKAAPPGPIPRIPPLPPKASSKANYKPLYLRVRQRYFEELSAIRSEVGGDDSDDENYPEGPPEKTFKKRKQNNSVQNTDSNVSGTLGGIDTSQPTSLECLKNVLAAHRARRQYRENHPELNTTGISLEDIKQRVALVNGAKKLMFGGQKLEATPKLKRGPKKEPSQKQSKVESKAVKRKEDIDSVENKPLLPNIKIKCEQEESDSESSSFIDPITSPKQPKTMLDHVEIKQEVVDMKYPNVPNVNYSDQKLEGVIKQEPLDPASAAINSSRMTQPVPIKLEDLDGIDMMALPVEIADDCGDLPADTSTENEESFLDPDESLTETTHANFLSLVRALFPARTAHRASKQQLHARCVAVMRSPIAPLNTWYNLAEDWCSELDSALDFLAGERGPHPDDFVPYLQFMPETQMYQWIGAGRDCDAILGRLCERWLRSVSPPPLPSEPPPPRYPTSWVVRSPSSTDISEFRSQERRRFSSTAKPFTYVQHGYRSVVGPCARASISCGGHANLLLGERPRHATFIALVRDAVARLPNGEGTRHDVLTLLKMSQWIAPVSDNTLLGAVSSALDRLHAAKRDPFIKYDQRTAVWTYLHRHRSEEDWLKSSGSRGRSNKTNTPSGQVTASVSQRDPTSRTPPPMDLEVGSIEEVVDNASDSDVDVDDTGMPSVPHISSAQLLMQQAQAQTKKVQPTKGKAKTTTPPKPKPKAQPAKQNPQKQPPVQLKPPAQPKPTTQPPKQSQIQTKVSAPKAVTTQKPNLMTQSAKQANVIAQMTKQIVPKQVVNVKVQSPKTNIISKPSPSIKPTVTIPPKQVQVSVPKPLSVVTTSQSSPLIKQRPLLKVEAPQAQVPNTQKANNPPTSIVVCQMTTTPPPTVIQTNAALQPQPLQNKVIQGTTRSLLIRPPAAHTIVTASATAPATQAAASARRGVVRVLSPAAPSPGKSLISPQALMQQGATPAKKRPLVPSTSSVTTIAQSSASMTSMTSVVSSVPTAVTSSVSTRTVQLAGGRTVQLAANQTVHLPGGQAVQLAGHTLQLSSLQLPTHSVRLPTGQTVQLSTAQMRSVSTAQVKTSSPKPQQSSPKPIPQQTVQIPVSTVQLAGQTVQIGGQTVQLSGVQLTGHTVKLPSGQSVQVASQSVLPSQLGQTVQLGGNVQTVLGGQNVLTSGQSVLGSVQLGGGQTVQLPSGQTLQLPSGQTVQLPSGQTVQLPSGQTVQLPSGQTVQLSSGQTLQLSSGQTVQLANPQTPKSIAQVVRAQNAGDKTAQPIVAKLLTNAQVAGARPRVAGVRVLSPSARLLLTSAKPLHNIILQSDGSAIRVPSSGAVASSQAIVLSNIGAQAVSSSTTTAPSGPVLKLQQVNPIHQVKLAQGIKIQQAVPNATVSTSSGVRSVLMDGQQLKLVGGRHVLARILRPAHPPP